VAEQVYWDDVNDGDEITSIKKNCSTQQLVHWAAASGDFYQIHYDRDFAGSTGLDNIIVHGALKNAFLGQLLHDWAAPGGTIREFGCEYRGMDFPNQDITCRGIVTAKSVEGDDHIVELDIWTENLEGQKTTPGIAIVILPAR
jgi:acyl dehydratase